MLRITTHENPQSLTFQLEGRLEGMWAAELAKCWRSMLPRARYRKTRVDLAGVTFVDELGKAVLAAMHGPEVEFHAPDCLTNAIVEEITRGEPLPTQRIEP